MTIENELNPGEKILDTEATKSVANKIFQKGLYCTLTLILVNIVVFILMLLNGVDLLTPDSAAMIKWGANFRPETLKGGGWRLFAANFLHFGIVHLAFNMFALLYIGKLLEPLLTSKVFALIYILSGFAAGLASLYWHPYSVSAGASGAIFGMFGVYFFLLSSQQFDFGDNRKKLINIIILIIINLVAGYVYEFDNAAHIGGLVAGIVLGKLFLNASILPEESRLWKMAAAYSIAGALVIGGLVYATTNDFMGIYEQKMKRFTHLESGALEVFQRFANITPEMDKEFLLYEINDRGTYYWREARAVLDEISRMDLSEEILQRNLELKRYCDIYLKMYDLMHRSIQEESRLYDAQIADYQADIEKIVKKLTKS